MLETIATALITSLLATASALYLARHRMEREFRLQYRSETIIRKLLSHPDWSLRSLDVIKHHLGGFEDNELRRHLVQAGALRFYAGGVEMWGLFERTQHSLGAKEGYKLFLNSVPEASERAAHTSQTPTASRVVETVYGKWSKYEIVQSPGGFLGSVKYGIIKNGDVHRLGFSSLRGALEAARRMARDEEGPQD